MHGFPKVRASFLDVLPRLAFLGVNNFLLGSQDVRPSRLLHTSASLLDGSISFAKEPYTPFEVFTAVRRAEYLSGVVPRAVQLDAIADGVVFQVLNASQKVVRDNQHLCSVIHNINSG